MTVTRMDNVGIVVQSLGGRSADPEASRHWPKLRVSVMRVEQLFSFVPPAKYKAITVQQIAKAMVATSLHPPATFRVYDYPEMVRLNAGAP